MVCITKVLQKGLGSSSGNGGSSCSTGNDFSKKSLSDLLGRESVFIDKYIGLKIHAIVTNKIMRWACANVYLAIINQL